MRAKVPRSQGYWPMNSHKSIYTSGSIPEYVAFRGAETAFKGVFQLSVSVRDMLTHSKPGKLQIRLTRTEFFRLRHDIVRRTLSHMSIIDADRQSIRIPPIHHVRLAFICSACYVSCTVESFGPHDRHDASPNSNFVDLSSLFSQDILDQNPEDK